jgi:hypothetical protein
LLSVQTVVSLIANTTTATGLKIKAALDTRAYDTAVVEFGRPTITAVTVFERLRGYNDAIGSGKPYQLQLRAFRALVAGCVLLPFDEDAASCAARSGRRARASSVSSSATS